MASVIVKWQKCGKPGCRCNEGILHGPYFWLVTYISRKSSDKRKGKYSWRYLGRSSINVWNRLEKLDDRFNEKYNLNDLNEKIHKLKQNKEKNIRIKSMEHVLTIDDAIIED